MYVDIISLRTFYNSPLGREVQKTILPIIEEKKLFVQGQISAGFGYSLPYFPVREHWPASGDFFALMPSKIGSYCWPDKDHNLTILVQEDMLPLGCSTIDNFLLVHLLEFAADTHSVLQEIWRVLLPHGRVVLIVPNRLGLWAQCSDTPFGHGFSYYRLQIQKLLQDCGFKICDFQEGLKFSPFNRSTHGFAMDVYGKMRTKFFPNMGGVLVIEAQKDIYSAIAIQKEEQKIYKGLAPVTANSS